MGSCSAHFFCGFDLEADRWPICIGRDCCGPSFNLEIVIFALNFSSLTSVVLVLKSIDCSSWSCYFDVAGGLIIFCVQLLSVRLCLVSWCNIVIEFLWNDVDALLICCTDLFIVIGVPMAAQWLPHWVPWRCLGHFLRIGAACDTWSFTGSVNIGAAQSTACLIFEVDGSPVLEEVAADHSSILELPAWSLGGPITCVFRAVIPYRDCFHTYFGCTLG